MRMCAQLAAQAEVQRIKGEQEKDYAALRAQHNDELAKMRDVLGHAKSVAKAEVQDLKERHKQEQERLRTEQREREKDVRAELQEVLARHLADLTALKETHLLDMCQKRPTTVSKETYYGVKRDLLQCQKRPTTVSKVIGLRHCCV